MNKGETAKNLFEEGYNCSQAVVGAFCDELNIDRDTAYKLASSFGGGMGRMREVCGVVTSASLIIGLMYGATEGSDKESKALTYEKVREFADKFKEKENTIICRELLGIDKAEESHIPEERTKEYYDSRPCPRLTKEAALILEEMIENRNK